MDTNRLDRALIKLCAHAGIRPSDAQPAIAAFHRGGVLNRAEVAALGCLSAVDRSLVLGARYGADGARVAALVVACGEAVA